MSLLSCPETNAEVGQVPACQPSYQHHSQPPKGGSHPRVRPPRTRWSTRGHGPLFSLKDKEILAHKLSLEYIMLRELKQSPKGFMWIGHTWNRKAARALEGTAGAKGEEGMAATV